MSLMSAGSGQIPARRKTDSEPLLILGFDEGGMALCNLPDGELEWVDCRDLVTSWRWDRDNEVWYSDAITLEDLALSAEEAVRDGDDDDTGG